MAHFQDGPVVLRKFRDGVLQERVAVDPGDAGHRPRDRGGELVPVGVRRSGGVVAVDDFEVLVGVAFLRLQMLALKRGDGLKKERPQFDVDGDFRAVLEKLYLGTGGTQGVLNNILRGDAT